MTEPGPGHNSKNAAGHQIKAFIERVERLDAERKVLSEDISDIYKEAKGTGLDVKVLRRIVAQRKKDPDKVKEENAVFETYVHAIGQEYLA
jgi:uncharacterized protein (UPF0335 family)